MNKPFSVLAVSAAVIFLFSSVARAEIFFAYLEGRQQVPAAATTATGYARIFVDEAAGTLQYTIVFNGLSSNQTASHIHAPAPIGANTGVAINFGAVGGTSGTISGSTSITAAQLTQIRQHLGYVNVHTANFPGGEIRGQLGIKRPVDFDGDGRQDISVARFPIASAAPMTYYNLNSTEGLQVATWGDRNLDIRVPGDYDGDGRDDFAVYRPGPQPTLQSYFYILRSSDNTPSVVPWGVYGDRDVARDFDGDGKTDPAVFRKGDTNGAQAYWYVKQSTTNTDYAIPFGTTGLGFNGDVPVPGDYDGDGKFDFAVYRFGGFEPNNTFIVRRSSDGGYTFQQWGQGLKTEFVVPGDYDGDGKYDFCVVRYGALATTPLEWYILQSSDGGFRALQFGLSFDAITQGDYDGDGRTDISVYRPGGQSYFYSLLSFDNSVQAVPWGVGGDEPVASFDMN